MIGRGWDVDVAGNGLPVYFCVESIGAVSGHQDVQEGEFSVPLRLHRELDVLVDAIHPLEELGQSVIAMLPQDPRVVHVPAPHGRFQRAGCQEFFLEFFHERIRQDHRETESHGCSLTLDVELVLVLEIAAFQADFHQSADAGH